MKSVVRFGFFLLLCAAILLPATAFSVEDGEIAVNEESFPDPVFREWILDENNIGAVGADGILTKEEREAVTRISVPGMGISSLKGVELFPELQVLICRNNLLTTLDVSKNSKLVTLLCDINRLTTLDLSQNPKLVNLNCELNYLTELNLRGCTELDWLYCRHNMLEQLDLSTNSKLTFIETFDNRLTSIDLSNLTILEFIHIDHNHLRELDLSHNTALVNSGSGFVVRNNYIEKIILPDHEDLTVGMDVYAEQNSKEGYANTEWYLDPEFTMQIQGDVQAKGQTIYAKWIPNPYTIRFDAAGGTGTVAPISTTYDEEVVLPSGGVTRKGYTLTGWMGYVDGKNRLYAPGATVKNLTGKKDWQTNITLYAQWEPYQAKLEANGGQFLDGQESKILPVTGQTALISLPDGDEVKREGMELVAWAGEAQPAFDPSTPFYLPGSDVEAAKGSDFYAQWLADEQLFLYHGPDGSVRIQKPEGETVSLYGAETFLEDGKPLLIWNTEADGSGESYLPGASVEHSRWGDKITHFYALWRYPTRTELTLTQKSYFYTGQPVNLKNEVTVTCNGAAVDGAQLQYYYYSFSDPETPLSYIPVNAGHYFVQVVFPGNPDLEQMESRSQKAEFFIAQGTAELSFRAAEQTLLWTGEAAVIQEPVLTLNGLPFQTELLYWYRAGESDPWSKGLPAEAGIYQLRAEVAETENHTAATAETTLRIVNFQHMDGTVKGAIELKIPEGTGTCQVVVALYDKTNGQMLDVWMKPYSQGVGTVVLSDLNLRAMGREQLQVKTFILGEHLSAWNSGHSVYEVWQG